MIRISFELETGWGMSLYRSQIRYFPGFLSFNAYKRLEGSTEKIGDILFVFRWNLIEYRKHCQWVKNAWFDNTIKPPYVNLSDHD